MRAKLIKYEKGLDSVTFVYEAQNKDIDEVPKDAEIRKYHGKRTLSANDKYQVTIGEIAQILGVPRIEIHNKLLNDLGIYQMKDGKPMVAILEDELDYLKMENIHLQPTKATKVLDNGKLYRVYYILKGSSEMNAQEFAKLCDMAIMELEEVRC